MPTPTVLRLYADEKGESHFEVHALDFEVAGSLRFSGGAASRYSIREVPPGWKREWGPTARPTLAVYLSGEGRVEASDGELVRVGPGVMLLAEDTTGVAIMSRIVGPDSHKVSVGVHRYPRGLLGPCCIGIDLKL